MELLPHQVKASKKIQKKLKKHGVCLLAGQPRSGKTLSFIDAAHKLYNCILIITTKKAMTDIAAAAISYGSDKFTVINYHSCQKLHLEQYDCIILDECHNYITSYPKRSAIWKNIFEFTKKRLPIIYSSGTPTPEGYAGLFNMFALSYYSPWVRYRSFAVWHKDYGIAYKKIIGYDADTEKHRYTQAYDRVKNKKVKKCMKPLTVKITRKEAGHKFEAEDKLHHIPLSKEQSEIIEILDRDRVYIKKKSKGVKRRVILADLAASLPSKKRQVAGGVIKCEKERLLYIKDNPKITYVKENFNPDECIILAFFEAEQNMLSEIFPNVGSITSNAEGVDYSHYKYMIIYSLGHAYKTYDQVRARQLNMIKRKTEVIIHFLLCGVDQDVYQAVSNKQNFTNSWYRKNK